MVIIVEEYGYNVFCGTENIFCDITYFPHKCATFVVPFVFWFTKMLKFTKSLRSMAKFALKTLWNRKHFLWYYVFSSQMRHLCGSLCILVFKNADKRWVGRFNWYYNVFWILRMFPIFYFGLQKCWRWQFLVKKSLRSMAENVLCRFKGFIICIVEQKTFSVILRIFLPNAPPLWFPFVFWFTKMLTLTIFTQNRWGVWLKFLCRFKWIIMCFVEQKFFSKIRIFLTNAPPLCSLCILVYADIDVFTQSRLWPNFLCRFKGCYNVYLWNRKHFLWYFFLTKCATFVVPFVFWFTKMLTLTILLKIVEDG